MPGGPISQLLALNQKLTISQKLSMFTLSLLVFFGMWGFVYLFNQDQYQLLESNLSAQDASGMVERLRQINIPYRLGQDGSSISVPTERIAEARLEMASAGLLSKGHTWDIFQEGSFGKTQFVQEVNYLMALQGELESSIMTFSEVDRARVHLVLPKDSLFVDEREPAKASVVVKMRTELTPSQVRGITRLVASAVEGLNSENVTVVDGDGNILSRDLDQDVVEENAHLDHRTRLEENLSQDIVATLGRLVGPGKVTAKTRVVVDFREIEETEEIFDPDGTVVLSEQTTEDRMTDTSVVGGVPGTAANQPDEDEGNLETTDQRVRSTNLRNYEVSKTVVRRTSPKGEIRRVTASVVVDHATETTTNEEGEVVTTTRPRTPEEMEQFRNVVYGIVGFDEQRGDSITVENVPFHEISTDQIEYADPGFLQQYQYLILPAMRYLGILVLFLLVYFLVFRPVKKKVFSNLEIIDPALAELAEATGDTEMASQLGQRMASLRGDSMRALSAGEMSVSEKHAEIKKQLVELASREPLTVTRLVRTWLAQDS